MAQVAFSLDNNTWVLILSLVAAVQAVLYRPPTSHLVPKPQIFSFFLLKHSIPCSNCNFDCSLLHNKLLHQFEVEKQFIISHDSVGWVGLFPALHSASAGSSVPEGWKEPSLQYWLAHMPCAWVEVAEELVSAGLLARLAMLPAACSSWATSFPQGLPIRVARRLSSGSNTNGACIPMACGFPGRLFIGSNVSWPPIKAATGRE